MRVVTTTPSLAPQYCVMIAMEEDGQTRLQGEQLFYCCNDKLEPAKEAFNHIVAEWNNALCPIIINMPEQDDSEGEEWKHN